MRVCVRACVCECVLHDMQRTINNYVELPDSRIFSFKCSPGVKCLSPFAGIFIYFHSQFSLTNHCASMTVGGKRWRGGERGKYLLGPLVACPAF